MSDEFITRRLAGVIPIQKRRTVKVQEVATPGPWSKYSCDFCDEVSDAVERRVYGYEYCIIGRATYFREEGLNEYCPVCGEPVTYKTESDIPKPIRGKALTRAEQKWVSGR